MLPSGPIPTFVRGKALQDGDALNKLSGLIGSTQNNITAQADTTKANATPIDAVKARVATVAGAADSVLLPPGYPGLQITLYNAGDNSMQVFGSGLDTINGVATGTGVAHGNGKTAIYTCYDVVAGVGLWSQLLGA